MVRARTQPNDQNCSEDELLLVAKTVTTFAQSSRLQAIRALILGFDFEQVSQLHGVSIRSLERWVARFNCKGIDGLIDAPRSGRPAHIPPEKTDQYRALIDAPQSAGHTHWTAHKFHGYLRNELDHEVGYRTVVRWLHDQNYRLKVPRPWPDKQDEDARIAFVDRVNAWLDDENVELWYQDEMGVEGDPRPRKRWMQKGAKGRVTRNGGHLRMNVSGMVCPRTGQFFALEMSHSDREMFQLFLDEANGSVTRDRPRNLLIMDNASWHKCKGIDWGHFEPMYLPPYSPDLNPIERLWLLVKTEWFSDFVAKTHEALMDRLDLALRWVIDRAEGNQTTCRIKTKL